MCVNYLKKKSRSTHRPLNTSDIFQKSLFYIFSDRFGKSIASNITSILKYIIRFILIKCMYL